MDTRGQQARRRSSLTPKTVLITGGSTGIGYDLARRLALSGYTVIATARHPETLHDLPVALALPLDVTDPASVASATDAVMRRFGCIDVLVNNAGYALRGALEEVPVDDVQAMFDVNVFGVLRMIQEVVPQMRRQGSGRIVNISSIAGRCSTTGSGTYSATKFAVEALSDALRWELAPFGIQVVIIEPGSISNAVRGHRLGARPDHPGQCLFVVQHPLRTRRALCRVDASARSRARSRLHGDPAGD